MFDVTFSIITYNSQDTIQRCLNSIMGAVVDLRAEIYVIDNASSDNCVRIVREQFPSVRLICCSSNQFFPVHNRVIEKARSRYVAIVNPDVYVDTAAVRGLLNFLDASDHVVAVCPGHRLSNGEQEPVAKRKITPRDCFWGYSVFSALSLARKRDVLSSISRPSRVDEPETPVDAEVLQDSCLFVRTAALQAIGGYNKHLKLYFTEDDLCIRLAPHGRTVYLPHLLVEHIQSTSVKKEPPFRIRKIRYLDMLTYLRIHYGSLTYVLFLPITYLSIFAWRLWKLWK